MGYGKKLYFEGANVGYDYLGTDFFSYLGIQYLDNGLSNEVAFLRGQSNTITEDLQLDYFGGKSPHFGVDLLDTAVGAKRLFVSEEGITRVVGYKKNGYAVITSSVVIGAFADGDFENCKMYVLSEYLNYLLSEDVVNITEKFNKTNNLLTAYPNPFTDKIIFKFPAIKNAGTIEIVDVNGKTVFSKSLSLQQNTLIWDGKNNTGVDLKSGLYFVRFYDGQRQLSKKIQKL